MNYSFYLAQRLSLGSGGKKFSPAVGVAVTAIAIAVAVMIASIAIVLGFKKEITEKVVGVNGHISIYRLSSWDHEDNLISLNKYLRTVLDNLPFVTEYHEQASLPTILKTPTDFKGVYLRSLKGDVAIDYIRKSLEEGEVPDYSQDSETNRIIISRKAANQLMLNVGDKIDTYFITDDVRVRRLEIAGIYNTHFDQYDDVLIFGAMPLVAQVGNLEPDTGTFIVLQTSDFGKIQEYSEILQDIFNDSLLDGTTRDYYGTDNVLNQGRGFFSWLSLLDTNVIVIIILMLVVGSVTLVSGMLIIILERKRFIGLMRALGARTSKIRMVFIYMSIKISLIGILIGDFIVIVILYIQARYHFLALDADSYYIDFVPVYLPGWIIAAIDGGVLLMTYLVLVLPSRFVAKISPAESMVRTE